MARAPWIHSLEEDAVPMIGVDRTAYIKAITEQGFVPYIEAGTGVYFKHPHMKAVLWVTWEFQREDGRVEWWTKMDVIKDDDKPDVIESPQGDPVCRN